MVLDNKYKAKSKNTLHNQVSRQNVNINIGHIPRPRAKAKPRAKPKPKQSNDLSLYDLMIYRNTHLQPSYSYNLPLQDQLKVQTPDYTKKLDDLLFEFRNRHTQPITVNNTTQAPQQAPPQQQAPQQATDEEKLKRFNETRKEYYEEKNKNINKKLDFNYMTSPLKNINRYEEIQTATPMKLHKY